MGDIYKNPQSKYQEFVNAFRRKNPYGENKDTTNKANKLWSTVKYEESKVLEYIASAPKRRKTMNQSKINFSSSISKSPEPEKVIITDEPDMAEIGERSGTGAPGGCIVEPKSSKSTTNEPSSSNVQDYPDVSGSFLNKEAFLVAMRTKETKRMLMHLISDDDDLSTFLDDSAVWNESIFRTTCEIVSKHWCIFDSLRKQYLELTMRNRSSSMLTEYLSDVEKLEQDLNSRFSTVVSIKTDSTVGISNLVRNVNLKNEEIIKVVSSLLELQAKITCNNVLYALRRRIRQQHKTQSYSRNLPKSSVSIICYNNCSLSWECALNALIEIENGNSANWNYQMDHCLSLSELISVSNLMKDSTAVSDAELALYIPKRLSTKLSNVIRQLASHLPVLVVSKMNCQYAVNMHQIDFDDASLDDIFEMSHDDEKLPAAKESTEKNTGRKGGRKSILEKFPQIPQIATEFIKASGYKAQERRRNTTITTCGVSIQDVREHLLKFVPGLRKHGLSETSVRYLFKPVRKGTFAAESYKSAIDATVPCKDNSLRKDNKDAHYLSSRVKLRREFISYFKDECTVASADSMNKIRYGTLAVSRYHQIRRIFMNDDKPKYLDHDFPLPYKTIPDGIMILSDNGQNDLFVDEDLVNCSAHNIFSNQIPTNTEVDPNKDDQQERLTTSLFRAAYDLGDEVQIFEHILSGLKMHGLDVNTLKEKIVSFLLSENMSNTFVIDQIKSSIINEASVNAILRSVAELFQVKFVIYNNLTLAPIIVGNSLSFSTVINFGMLFEYKDDLKFFSLDQVTDPEALKTFEELDRDSGSEGCEESEETSNVDDLGREHVLYPHTGPSIIYLRNSVFHDNTCLEHINDLFPICIESRKKGKPVFTLIADNGPDYNPNSVKNLLLYCKLFQVANLDQFSVISYAAGWSALNPIEHLWSKCSTKLTSVHLDSSMRDDGIPPCKDSSINEEEKERQEKILLEKGARDIAAYWSEMRFDGHTVTPVPVDCDGRPGDFMKSAASINDFIKSPLRDIRANKHRDSLKLFKFATSHVDRRKNEMVFRKCQFFGKPPCDHCHKNPPTAEKVLEVLRKTDGFMFEPTPSANPELNGHYMTFLEMLKLEDTSGFSKPNEKLPSKSIGKCAMCPAWQFSSVTESKRHISILHPNYRKDLLPSIEKKKQYTCTFKSCGRVFETYHQLKNHKMKEKHYVRKNAQERKGSLVQKKKNEGEKTKEKIQNFFNSPQEDDSGEVEVEIEASPDDDQNRIGEVEAEIESSPDDNNHRVGEVEAEIESSPDDDLECGSSNNPDFEQMKEDEIEIEDEKLRFGDYIRVKLGDFEGYFAAIIEEADDEVRLQYFKEKRGKPYGKYWVLADSENEKEWRARGDLAKIIPEIDWRGRFVFE